MAQPDVAALKVERGRLKASFTKLHTFATNIPPNKTIIEIKVKLEKLEEYMRDFKRTDDLLVASDVESDYDTIEDRYFEIKIALRQFLGESSQESTRASTPLDVTINSLIEQQNTFLRDFSTLRNTSQSASASHVKLPKIDIPSFDGDYKDWPSFKDLFTSSVDQRQDLSPAIKFQLLKSAVKGEAASLIKHLIVTDENYAQAWEKLLKRYDKKRQIISAYIKAFVNQPNYSQSSSLSTTLRRIADTSDQLVRGIDVLGTHSSSRDPWLIYIIISKLDAETRKDWAEKTSDVEFPTFNSFIEFLNKRCDAIETCDSSTKRQGVIQHVKSLHLNTSSCVLCSKSHQLFKCPEFKAMSTSDKRSFVSMKALCFNCLNSGHLSKKCSSRFRCHFCKQAHHSSLHEDKSNIRPSTQSAFNSQGDSQSADNHDTLLPSDSCLKSNSAPANHVNAFTVQGSHDSTTLLPTAIAMITDTAGSSQRCRVLLDSGSEASFISEDCVQRLGLKREKANVYVHGLSTTGSVKTQGKVAFELTSMFSTKHRLWVQAFILKKLTTPQPSRSFNFDAWHVVKNYPMADSLFNTSRKIDIIIGADHFFKVIQDGQIHVSDALPQLQNTMFGYVMSGTIHESLPTNSMRLSSLTLSIAEIDCTLKKFWEIEEIPESRQMYSEEENLCEKIFCETHYVDTKTQRYVVKLPFKENNMLLGDSVHYASSFFNSLEHKLKGNEYLRKEYSTFMNEYHQLEHMELIPKEFLHRRCEHMYLPHHAVIKSSSSTTKVRVVFNGSASTSSGLSLNQKLLVGPKVQKDLIEILLLFRTFKIAVVADIEKMFRQILVDKEDRNFQRIIWRDETTKPLQHFWLNTVTYGTSSAPYLATRALKQLTIDFKGEFPLAEKALLNNFYVDDLLGGAENEEEALTLYSELNALLKRRGFSLRKWISNSKKFLSTIKAEEAPNSVMKIDEHPDSLKVLGLKWIPTIDCFSFEVLLPDKVVPTKRCILSETSKVFDPLGFLAPVTIAFKILLQQLWLRNYDWDDECDDIGKKWISLRSELHQLQQLQIPRFLFKYDFQIQLHGFADASELAYAAVVYCRVSNIENHSEVTLVAAKTRVSPIKQLSIPRLELCAAVLLAKLMKYVKTSLNIKDEQCFAWTDSSVVLTWLSSHPRRWKCFIANRTSMILTTLPSTQWRHVQSTENPADLASRGVSATKLIHSTLWWNGPSWLKKGWETIPTRHSFPVDDNLVHDEERPNNLHMFHTNIENSVLSALFERHSKLGKIIQIISRCFQFIRLCRTKSTLGGKNTTCIQATDVNQAFRACELWSQQDAFGNEIKCIQNRRPIHSHSSILTLTPFIDNKGVLRVGGRLEKSNASYETKHPIILAKDHIFTKYLITYYHYKYLHTGTSNLLNILRTKYWILSCRNLIKSCVNKCLICIRRRTTTSQQLMAHLPKHRVGEYRAFEHTGLDYAGPITLLIRRGRGARTTKAYIALFVCFSTRAIHLEIAGDLTAETFVAALKRFTSRRGLPSKLYSDNGTNFVGAHRQLKDIYKLVSTFYEDDMITHFLSLNNITWEFNPPSAPHHGGLWEAGVKCVKSLLGKVIGETKLTYEEMYTVLVQIEGLLNSRPLVPLSDDVSSIDALTPAHFLIGQPIVSLPEQPTECFSSTSLHERWHLTQRIHQHFWRRWHLEYISTLQKRPKWQQIQQNFDIGNLVLVKEPKSPPSKWILGRVIQTHPGSDNLVRVVTIRTATGELVRPITKLCKLPA